MRKIKFALLLLCATKLCSSGAEASTPEFFSLSKAEEMAQANSPQLTAALQKMEASIWQAKSQHSRLYPRLSFEASYRHLSEVPEIHLGPIQRPLGDNENYSLGPMISYTLFDGGATSHIHKSLLRMKDASQEEFKLTKRQVLLATRLAYTQAQLAAAQLRLAKRSLKLSKDQNREIRQRFRGGLATRLDVLNSQAEVSSYELRVAQSLGDYNVAVADLEFYTGDLGNTERLQFEPLEEATEGLKSNTNLHGPHPEIKSQTAVTESLEQLAKSQKALYWPSVQLQFKSSLDYPNGPTLEQIHQNTFLVNLSWPIFEFGGQTAAAKQKQFEAAASRARLTQTERNLERDRQKALARYQSLQFQIESADKNVKQADEVARLTYRTYKAGGLTFFEVQTANLRLLDTRVQQARIQAQLLSQYYNIRFLVSKESSNEQ